MLASKLRLLVGLLASGIPLCVFAAHNAGPTTKPAEPGAALSATYATDWRARQGQYFKRNWGVELISITPVSSGYMLALRYRILDPERAKVINDRKAKAYLVDEASGTVLAVPALENIGELRPGATPEEGRIYFMIFGNPGKLVKKGSHVTFRVGNLRAEGLVVE